MMKNIVIILSAVLLIEIQGQANYATYSYPPFIRYDPPISKERSTAIFFNSKGGNICSGALIHSLWILTTASCANKVYEEERRVTIGGYVNVNFNEASYIKNVIIHPSFNDQRLENDIALVELVKPTERTNRVLKISSEWIKPGEKAFALGYGGNGYQPGNGILRQEDVSVVDNKICARYDTINIDLNRLCSYEGRACEGDQGGPLLLPSNKLIGLISINKNQAAMCRTKNITTYVRISGYVHWIRKTTNIVYL